MGLGTEGGEEGAESIFLIDDAIEASAVDIERFEDPDDSVHGEIPLASPENDFEVFHPDEQTIEDTVEQEGFVEQFVVEEAEVTAIDFGPAANAFDMFEPAMSEESLPVLTTPLLDRFETQVAPGFLAFDPFVSQSFGNAVAIDALVEHDSPMETDPDPRGCLLPTLDESYNPGMVGSFVSTPGLFICKYKSSSPGIPNLFLWAFDRFLGWPGVTIVPKSPSFPATFGHF
jgi:hypothetical protein